MELAKIRRANLAIMVNEVGSVTALANLLNNNRSYFSQLLAGSRTVSDQLAVRLEFALNKSRGWMDEPHFEEEKLSKCRAFFDVLIHLPEEKIDALITLFDLKAEPGSLGKMDLEAIPRRKPGPRITKIDAEDHEQTKPKASSRPKRAR